jgi:TolB-like protein
VSAGALMLLALIGVSGWRLAARNRFAITAGKAERIIVADFANRETDSTLGSLVAHVLRNDLARSPRLAVVGEPTIADALRRMRRPPDARLTAETAREVAAREEVKLVLQGEVGAAGAGLVLTAAVIEASTGDVIHGVSETARDSTDVPAAIGRLSRAIREGIGLSLSSARGGDSLWSFTTSSLPALRKHMAGARAFWRADYPTAARLFEDAIALDPEFAHAHLDRWVALENAAPGTGSGLRSLARAYELRDGLTERERDAVEGNYHLWIAGDLPNAVSAFRRHVEALRKYPVGEGAWYVNLSYEQRWSGDITQAEATLREPVSAFQPPCIRRS